MPEKKTKQKNSYRERDKAAGIDRCHNCYIDDLTYKKLLKLIKHAGYDTDKDREIKQGISGVILHLVNLAGEESIQDALKDKKKYQQKLLLKRIAKQLLNSGNEEYEDVADIWKQYDVGKKILQGLDEKQVEYKIKRIITKKKKPSPLEG